MAIRPTAPGVADNALAADVKSAQELRGQLRGDRETGVRAAAAQFEALFLQMVLKSMRETTAQDGFLDSDSTRFFTGMLDEQLAKNLAQGGGGLGLAKLLEEQLLRQVNEQGEIVAPATTKNSQEAMMGNLAAGPATIAAPKMDDLPFAAFRSLQAAMERASLANRMAAANAEQANGYTDNRPATPGEFAKSMWPHAAEASRLTGVPPQFLIAHAALESGWGRQEIRNADGTPSHNLFGIKAGSSWQGESTEIVTTEYENGIPSKQRERFRSYASYAEAFTDYARLLAENPRYGAVIGSQNGTEFARRLQQAGYASDPKYAEKLAAIIDGPTLRQALLG